MTEITSLCAKCKGKGLCGKPCPIMKKLNKYKTQIKNIKKNFSGSAPSVFVGRYGYPNVKVGILSPPKINKNSWMLDSPEYWYNSKYNLDRVISARSKLIHSKSKGNIKKLENKMIENAQLISLAKKKVDTEFFLKKRPKPQFVINSHSAPIGSPAKVKNVKLQENANTDHKVEYIVDDDLKANRQIEKLYQRNLSVNKISKILSTGLLGKGKDKKLVPTRWSITATDNTISKELTNNIGSYNWINEYKLFHNEYMGNHYEILLIPRQWSYELIEAKTPGSVWNPKSKKTLYMIDYENHWGRKTYAKNCGGGYYAVRLPIAKYLNKIKKQASVLVVREVRPKYAFPVAAW